MSTKWEYRNLMLEVDKLQAPFVKKSWWVGYVTLNNPLFLTELNTVQLGITYASQGCTVYGFDTMSYGTQPTEEHARSRCEELADKLLDIEQTMKKIRERAKS